MSMDRRDDLDYETFFSEYMWKNKPVLIGEKMTRGYYYYYSLLIFDNLKLNKQKLKLTFFFFEKKKN